MMKKLLCLLLASAFALSAFGCGGGGQSSASSSVDEITYPVYLDDKEVFLSAYISPWENDAQLYDWAKEVGLTHLYVNYSTSTSYLEFAMEQCDRLGLKSIPMTCWDKKNRHSYKDFPIDVSGYESFSGFSILDEPNTVHFDYLVEQYQQYKVDFPDKVFYTNLFQAGVLANYETYFQNFIDKVIMPIEGEKIMSMTLYPMVINNDTNEKSIQSHHLLSLGKFAGYADRADAKMYHFVQSVSYNASQPRHAPTEADIRFQIYSGMAFGSKGFQYFTYATPNVSDEFSVSDAAMINRNNQRTAIYYGVQAVNNEISKFDHVFLSFDFKSAMLVNGANAKEDNPCFAKYKAEEDLPLVTSTETLKEVMASQDTLVGVLADGNGFDGYTVVNYTHPSYGLTDEVTLDFSGCKALIAYIDGEEYRYTLDSPEFKRGIFNISLKPGQGVFLIPVK